VQGAANNSNGSANSASNAAPAVQVPKVITLAQGTVLDVTLEQAISSKDAQRGEAFDAKLSRDVETDGGVAIPAGSRVHGTIMAAAPGGRANAPASLVLALSDVELAGAGASTAAAITNKDISIGTDSVLAFRLEQPVSISVKQ